MFVEFIIRNNAWYGYKQEAIGAMIDFRNEMMKSTLIFNDKTILDKLNTFNLELDKFNEYAACHLFRDHGGHEYYVVNKSHDPDTDKLKAQANKMNELSKNTKAPLINLLEYLNQNNYLD